MEGRELAYYEMVDLEQADLERKEELKASISREIDERIQKEWAAHEAALTGETDEEQILKVLCLLLAVPAKVLCEKFRWKPIEDENDQIGRASCRERV